MNPEIIKNFLTKKPFEEAYGLAGRSPRQEPMRQILGTSGGGGSFQVDQPKVAQPAVQNGEGGTEGITYSKKVIIVDDGVANYYMIPAQLIGPV